MGVELSIVIPAYNEGERLRAGYRRLAPTLEILGPSNVQVVVVDDGSSDDTMRLARELYGHLEHAVFVQRPTNKGKGAALRLGIALATAPQVVTADADMAIDPRHLPEFMGALTHHELVPGSRAVSGRIVYDQRRRTWTGALFNRLVRHYTHTTLRDTQCGCKGFQLGPARALSLLATLDGYAFDMEMLYLAERLGLHVKPLTVTWSDVAGSSVRPGRDAWIMLRDIRNITSTRYENPVVELQTSIDASDVAPLARATRLNGLVIARSEQSSLLVLGRDDALGGLGIADALGGTLRTAPLDELRDRRFEAV